MANITEPTTADEMLKTIDNFLSDAAISHYEQEQLWLVLSALRGPDQYEKGHIKRGTTCVLRTLAFPKTAGVLSGAHNVATFDRGPFLGRDLNEVDHYDRHTMKAYDILRDMGRIRS